MILKRLQLTQFKNHLDSTFEFDNHLNCIVGKNGVGKTNLLDAIYMLSFTKSAVGATDKSTVTHGMNFYTVLGEYDDLKMAIKFENGQGKTIKLNGVEQKKTSEIIGKIPLVLVTPDDTAMIREGSDLRRKFFDGAISQFDKAYLEDLIAYNRLLKQRNQLLKQAKDGPLDKRLLETYNEQIIPLSVNIAAKRQDITKPFLSFLRKNYAALHSDQELPDLSFSTHVNDSFGQTFKDNLQRDMIMQRTLLGCHKDDFLFELDSMPIKKFGSQGQQKTFIISLKLALYDYLAEQTGMKPIVLLDDIFDKLDDSRIRLLVELLSDQQRFGQIFITDARNDRSSQLFESELSTLIEMK